MTTDSNFYELSRLVKILGDKIDKLGNDSESRHDVIYAQLKQFESTTASLNSELKLWHVLQFGDFPSIWIFLFISE